MNHKYENFINSTKTLMEENLIVEFLEDYEKEDIQQKINIYINQLQQYLKGYRNDLPNIIYEDRLFKEAWLKLAFNSDFTNEEFGSLIKTCFSKYSPSFIIMNMKQKDIKYLECVLENIPLRNNDKEAIEKFEDTLNTITERKTSNAEHGLDFNEEWVIDALKVYLMRHEKYLSDPNLTICSNIKLDDYDSPVNLPLTEVTLCYLNFCIPNDTYKLRKYLPLLPQASESEDVLSVANNAIIQVNVNKGALINKYKKILTNENINTTFQNITSALNNMSLSGLDSVIYNISQHNKEQVNLLFIFSSPESLDTKVLVNFIENILDIYCDNYSVTSSLKQEESDIFKKAIHNCWLDAKIPNKNVEKKTKIKI